MLENNDFFKQAREELSYLSGDPDFQELVRSRAFFLMDQHSLNQQAKREGKKEEQLKMAKKLLKLKMPIEQIIELTELSKEELEEIKD